MVKALRYLIVLNLFLYLASCQTMPDTGYVGYSFLDNVCALPCWNDITPGMTDEMSLVSLLETNEIFNTKKKDYA